LAVSVLERERWDEYWRRGFSLSIVAHILLAYIIFVKVFPDFGDVPEPIVYSISIEGGKSVGGMSQVPKEDKPSPIAPMKNVSAETKKEPDVQESDKKVKEEPVDDAEVSIADKKPTPKPTAQPTPAKTATPAPAKKTDAKKDVKNTKKSDGEDVDKRLQAALQRYLGESSDGGGKGFGAAKATGGNSMGGGVVRPPEFFVYEKIVRSRIKEAWRWYDTNTSRITVIAFEIEPDGVINNVRLVKSSGDSAYDESVMRAAMKASPLPPPPRSVYEQYFKSVRITFDPRE
jgi:colicin import membrane protein